MLGTMMEQGYSLAWSQDNDDDLPIRHGRSVSATLLVLVFAIVIVVVWLGFTLMDEGSLTKPIASQPSSANVQSTMIAPVAWPPQAVPDVVNLNMDDRFTAEIRSHGIVSPSAGYAINAAHLLCTFAAQGQTRDQITEGMEQANPSLTHEQVTFLVNLSLDTYCPKQGS